MAVSQIAASASNADVPDNDYIAKHKPLPIRIGTHLRRYWQLWLMALPAMVFVFIFAYIPMYGIQLAFREFVPRKGLTGGTFVGLAAREEEAGRTKQYTETPKSKKPHS